eukprot:4889479-Amphidinium_carterae.1
MCLDITAQGYTPWVLPGATLTMPTAGSEQPEEEPEWAVVSPASSRSSLLPPSSSPRLPARLSAQSLLRGQLFVPKTGELYVVWALHDSPFGAQLEGTHSDTTLLSTL